jgi:hypothetical protein
MLAIGWWTAWLVMSRRQAEGLVAGIVGFVVALLSIGPLAALRQNLALRRVKAFVGQLRRQVLPRLT